MLTKARDEEGSVVMAVTVMMVATFVVMAFLATILNGLDAARVDQARTTAMHQADAGIDAALYHIDRQDWTGVTWVTQPSHFTLSTTSGTSRFDVDAHEVTAGDDSQWTVKSIGTETTTGRKRQTIATIGTAPLFTNALFSVGNVSVTGVPPATVTSTLGSNGSITLPAGGSSWWNGFNLYGKTTQTDANSACTNCGGAPKVAPVANALTTTVPSAPATISACPVNGIFFGTVQPGDYLCANQAVTLWGPVTVGIAGNGTGKVRIWVSGAGVGATGTVNANGSPANFQVFESATSTGGTYSGSICGATIWGVLYAPGMAVNCPTTAATLHGAAVVGSWTGLASGLYYDSTTASIRRDGTYTASNWHECPATAADC